MDLSFLPKQSNEEDDEIFLETCYSPKEAKKIEEEFKEMIYHEIGDLYHSHWKE